MNRHFVLKAALTVALCIPPWGGVFETLTPQAKGQQTAWVVGSSQLAFSSEFNEAIVQAPLPVPNDPMAGDLQYDGTPAVRSQQLIQDQFGNLLGFLVDGSIYDRDGYRIADANPDISGYDTDDCVDCIPQGISQALVVPFPGQCYKFLVLTMVLGEGSGVVQAVRAYMALLDMSRPNAALVDLGLTDRTGALISLYPGGDADLDAFQFPTLLDGPNLFVRGLPLDVQTAFKVAGHMDAVDAGFDQEKWIFLTDGSSVTRYKLTASALTYEGFQQVPPLTQDENFQPDNWPQGELEAVRTSSEMRVAYSAHGYVFDPVTFESIHRRYIIYQRYSLSGAWLSTQRILVDEHLVDLTDPEWSRINGVEFSPNGRYVYFVKRQAPYFGYVDLEDQSVHALTADLSAYRYTQLATAPSAAEPDVLSIYAIANNGWLGALGNLDDPANLTWQPQALQLPMAPDCAGVDDAHDIPNIVGNPTDQYHMLHSGTAGYAAYGPDNAYVCCEKMSASEGFKYTAAPGSQTDWEPGDNPFLDFWSPVIIKDELRIAAGVHITASDMEFRFGPDAQLVIEPAGSFTCDHCILTSACPEIRWAGVRVEGNTTALQTTDYQGKLWLRYSTISNALTGVRCSDGSSAGYGGIVWCSYSTFSNCRTGVDIGEYHHSPGSLTVDDNNSFFSYTHFVTELPMPDTQAPWTHLYVHGTRKVRVTACSFANDVPNFFPVEQWGTGMRVYNAEIAVQGNTNPNFSYVRNLRTGIWRTGSPKMPITVDGMRFSGNRRGVHDDGGYFSRYTNNTFSIPDQGTAPTRREGMRLNQTRFFTVERNTFTGEDQAIGTDENSIGIFFLGIAPVDNGIWNYSAERIYDNTFTDLYAGTLVNNVHVSHDGFKDTEGLQILCGDYVNNVMDIALGPVSPIRSDQGSPIFSEDQQLAGNTFDHNLNPVDCDAIRDWDMDIEWNDIDPCTAMIIDYHRHEDADCAVACDSDEGSNPDLADDPLSLSGDLTRQAIAVTACWTTAT